jgi:hypothetical protein
MMNTNVVSGQNFNNHEYFINILQDNHIPFQVYISNSLCSSEAQEEVNTAKINFVNIKILKSCFSTFTGLIILSNHTSSFVNVLYFQSDNSPPTTC